MVVDQLRPLAIAWAFVETSGLEATMSGISRPRARASSRVMALALPRPELTPPERRLPANTMSMFCPRPETCDSILAFAPLPTATMATTANTPMMIPKAVRQDRSLFRCKARSAVSAVSRVRNSSVCR
jgi:hypothetical protein